MLALQDKKGIKKARAIQFCHDQSLPVFHDIYFFSDSVLLFGKRTASAKSVKKRFAFSYETSSFTIKY
jgi:hypothetical protein